LSNVVAIHRDAIHVCVVRLLLLGIEKFLIEARKKTEAAGVAIVRLEQFYPFPLVRLRELMTRYANAKQLVWAQEEPKNMGGWTFVEPRLEKLVPVCERPIYVGRAASASPATGSYHIHQAEQAKLLSEALTIG